MVFCGCEMIMCLRRFRVFCPKFYNQVEPTNESPRRRRLIVEVVQRRHRHLHHLERNQELADEEAADHRDAERAPERRHLRARAALAVRPHHLPRPPRGAPPSPRGSSATAGVFLSKRLGPPPENTFDRVHSLDPNKLGFNRVYLDWVGTLWSLQPLHITIMH